MDDLELICSVCDYPLVHREASDGKIEVEPCEACEEY